MLISGGSVKVYILILYYCMNLLTNSFGFQLTFMLENVLLSIESCYLPLYRDLSLCQLGQSLFINVGAIHQHPYM